jgi:hypothetical protein
VSNLDDPRLAQYGDRGPRDPHDTVRDALVAAGIGNSLTSTAILDVTDTLIAAGWTPPERNP